MMTALLVIALLALYFGSIFVAYEDGFKQGKAEVDSAEWERGFEYGQHIGAVKATFKARQEKRNEEAKANG